MHQTILPPPLPGSAVTFAGGRRGFVRLALRGGLLELITIGFYRFWLATDMRRHLWSQTAVGGDPAEYTGRARELLIGFLIAMAILVPVYLAYFLIGIEAERLREFASIPLVLFLYLFAEFARYRARRYQVTRTVWRGLRLSMGGSGWSYALRSCLWWVVVGLSLGLALPWRLAALERYKMRHTAYGTLQGRFEGTGGGLFKRAWFLWLLALPAAALVIPLPFLYAGYKAIEWRWWVSGLRFGEVRFECGMAWSALLGCYWTVIGWSLLLIVLLGAWFGAIFHVGAGVVPFPGSDEAHNLAIMQHPGVLVAGGLGYLLAVVAIGMVIRIYLNHDVWREIAITTTVYNLGAADNIAGQGMAADALGEGFADSLDIGGF